MMNCYLKKAECDFFFFSNENKKKDIINYLLAVRPNMKSKEKELRSLLEKSTLLKKKENHKIESLIKGFLKIAETC